MSNHTSISREMPSVADYLRLRHEAGLSPFTPEAAAAGLAGTIEAVLVRANGEAIGMGRVIGDGGLFFQVVDIAVLPEFQGRGLGKRIMAALMGALAERIPSRAYVSLVADGDAQHLYAQYGFESVAPKSLGMARWIDPAQSDSSPST
ncbi:GNAT family N-acetyltransferase [Tsuneonella mangrovi]|uniref:GNAT family N-acetyltransferase n=1 Tax=Tsuneonella mangrovi TaxID=1982042 RepID=UPI000BA22C57|nr:GNAT family N-acetyltransferase [Tsuneonella mangrovi]